MNNEIILQSLKEAFEIIKDSWESKKDAIINCIVETEIYDGSLSMDMWLYILKNHLPIINEKDSISLVNDVFDRFLKRNEENDFSSGENRCRAILNHVAPHLIKNDDLIYAIYGMTYNAGYEYYSEPAFDRLFNPNTAVCIACILLLGNPHTVEVLIKSLSQNYYMNEISIGKLLIRANQYVEYICRNEEEFGKKYSISAEVKETLLGSLQYIEDKGQRAECTIAFLSL